MLITVERSFPTGEAEERQRHRNRHIDSHLPHFHLVLVFPRGGAISSEDGGTVAVRAVVDQFEGLIQRVHADAAQHRAENFFPIDGHLRGHIGKQRRPDPVAVRQSFHGTVRPIQQTGGALLLALFDHFQHPLLGRRADLWAVRGLRVVPGAGANLGKLAGQLVDPGLGIAHKHRHADGHATLPCRPAGRPHQAADHLLLIGIGHDHHMVLGAGKALRALHVVGGSAVHVLPHRHRAHERHCLDVRVRQQGIYLLLTTVHHLQQARRCAGFLKQFGQPVRGHRVLLGGLEYEGVTRGDGQREHPQRDHGREVERGDPRTHAQRLGPGMGVDAAGHVFHGFAHHQRGDIGGLLGHFDATPHIPLGVLEGLAGFLAEDFGDLVVMLFQQRLIAQHQTGAFGHRHFFPGLERGLARRNGLLHFLSGSRRGFAQGFLGGRVGYRNPLVSLAGNKFAINQQG